VSKRQTAPRCWAPVIPHVPCAGQGLSRTLKATCAREKRSASGATSKSR
jgi:hypothetical protein